ncbi:hypothetical protein ACI77O_12165 [Pseudomonas tritici]|uniref:hypothetical protein n=1 Tax=Pseudomonas tritici TaxID=2745518 RepID=UPI00387B8761
MKHTPKFLSHLGKSFLIVAEFSDTDAGTVAANKHMTSHTNSGVLLVADGVINLSHKNDHGDGTGPVKLSSKAKRAVKNYGLGVCLSAYRMTEPGDGASTIGINFDLTTNQADAAIDAGAELAGRVEAATS